MTPNIEVKIDEERKERNEILEAFYRKHAASFTMKTHPCEIGEYLMNYDRQKYSPSDFYDLKGYFSTTSPWDYNEGLLEKVTKEDRVIYNTTSGIERGDPRFVIFVAQLDSKTDLHVALSVMALDFSKIPGYDRVADIYLKATLYGRYGEDFAKFFDYSKEFIQHPPDSNDQIGGYR